MRKIIIFLSLLSLFSCLKENTKTDAVSANTVSESTSVLKNVSVSEFVSLMNNNPNYVILDVRTDSEYRSGYIKNALNIDFYSSNFKETLSRLDLNSTYLIYCRSGNRSGQALNIMKQLGFNHVYNMLGGINQYNNEGYSLEK